MTNNLEKNLQEFLNIKSQLRTLNSDLKNYREEFEDADEIEKLTSRLKVLKNKRDEQDEYARNLRDKISDLKERKGLVEVIVLNELIEEQPSLDGETTPTIEFEGYTFKATSDLKLKIEKSKN